MKKSAILMGAEVTVKVPFAGTADQIRGTITAVDSATITITEKLDEKADKEPRVVKIPKASAEALAFHKNPQVPEADVEDGVLIVNGNAVRTGFEVAATIATLPNRVYLTAKVEDSDRVDVYSYNVAKDEFYKVTNIPLALVNADKPTEIGTSVIIPYLNKHEEEEEVVKEDGVTKEKVAYEVLEETGYLLISTVSTMAAVVKTELGNSPILDSKTLGDTAAYFVTTTNVTTENAAYLDRGYDCEDYNYDDEDYDSDDDYEDGDSDYGCNCRYVGNAGRIVPVKDDKIIIRMYRVEGRHLVQPGAVMMDGDYVSATIAGRTAVIKTTKAIHVDVAGRIYDITDKLAVKALEGYNYVVKNEMKNGVLKLWFANAGAEIKVYSVTPAEDARGPIIEVQ